MYVLAVITFPWPIEASVILCTIHRDSGSYMNSASTVVGGWTDWELRTRDKTTELERRTAVPRSRG